MNAVPKLISVSMVLCISSVSVRAMDVECDNRLLIENKSGWNLTIVVTDRQGATSEIPMRQGEILKEIGCLNQIRTVSFTRRGMLWGFAAQATSLQKQLEQCAQERAEHPRQDAIISIEATLTGWNIQLSWQGAIRGSLVMPAEVEGLFSESEQLGGLEKLSASNEPYVKSGSYAALWDYVTVTPVYKKIVMDYAWRESGNDAVPKLEEADNDPIKARMLVWGAIADHFGLSLDKDPRASGLWCWNKSDSRPLLRGQRVLSPDLASITFSHFNRARTPAQQQDIMSKLIGDYKIHLMPIGDMSSIMITLFELIQSTPELQENIWSIKVNSRYDDAQLKSVVSGSPDARPKIVIYPATGKDAAQRVLNILFSHFKNMPGLAVAPRFNQRVTDLIYVSQGNGDDKVGDNLDYFQAPGYIYFNREKVAAVLEVDPATLDFELAIQRN